MNKGLIIWQDFQRFILEIRRENWGNKPEISGESIWNIESRSSNKIKARSNITKHETITSITYKQVQHSLQILEQASNTSME